MRILSVIGKHYYGRPDAVEPLFLEFTEPLRQMGHEVEHFDNVVAKRTYGAQRYGEMLVEKAKQGRYDVVLFPTAFERAEEIGESLREASRYAPIVAWNSDDDWAWEQHTKYIAPFVTFMFTTYRDIYEANRAAYPNLRLSQWACYDRFGDFDRRKDLDFTFAGQIYGDRVDSCRYLHNIAGLQVYGYMSGRVHTPKFLYLRGIRKLTERFPSVYGAPITFQEVNDIWNRSLISYTPMEASVNPSVLQIKSRTFQMGLSGTLMICRQSPYLEEFYEPGKEFVVYETIEECAEKVKFYLRNPSERNRIARAYRDRTNADHLWQHRFRQMFEQIGLSGVYHPAGTP